MKRRTLIRAGLGLTAVAAFTGLYSWQIEPFRLEFVKKRMPIRGLPEALIGKTLMQISDMHVGDRFDRQFLIDSMKEASEFSPDIVVYTGDYVSYVDGRQFIQLEEVMEHAVKGRSGTVGILGNHDYGHGWAQGDVADKIVGILEDSGVPILRNASRRIAGLDVIGLDDYWATNFDPDSVLKDHDRDAAHLLLCHNPDVCDLDVWHGYEGWILSGHTHGGQVKPPFLPPPILPVKNKRYSAGEIDLQDGRTLYINRALGHLWQIRLNVRPEITIFTLDRA